MLGKDTLAAETYVHISLSDEKMCTRKRLQFNKANKNTVVSP